MPEDDSRRVHKAIVGMLLLGEPGDRFGVSWCHYLI